MITLRSALLAVAGTALLAPLAAAANPQTQPAETPPAEDTAEPRPDSETSRDTTAEESKRICKSVRADAASRRKTRVCRTAEEWRQLNVPL